MKFDICVKMFKQSEFSAVVNLCFSLMLSFTRCFTLQRSVMVDGTNTC